MKVTLFGSFLLVLYLTGFIVLGYAAVTSWDYYELPLAERPHATQHNSLKPGGFVGHGLGIIGSCMIMLLFLYSARKRGRLGLRFGHMGRWLDIHIWFGITGPLFITLHTAMKFNGLVSISYWSMVAVMASGFIGRYIYLQIPRDETGHALSVAEIENTIDGLSDLLQRDYDVSPDVIQTLGRRALGGRIEYKSGTAALLALVRYDITRPIRHWRLNRLVRRLYPTIPPRATSAILELAKRKASLTRRRAILRMINSIFHYWHVIHKPFAVVMIIIMLIHIAVVTLMGSTWIF